MKELVILSGKGGTGKTSLTAAFASFASNPTVADCDVDASNLHLLLSPVVQETGDYQGGHEAVIRPHDCIDCGLCETLCRFEAVQRIGGRYEIEHCEGCGVCVEFCPAKAIDWKPAITGTWIISDCLTGRMAHANLSPGAENSGKLTSLVRTIAKKLAGLSGSEFILVDGPPGIGCPVIASLTGSDAALVVTEPTPSGIHDLERILELTGHFGVDTRILVNKSDINEDLTRKIGELASRRGQNLIGTLPYNPLFTLAQRAGLPISVEFPHEAITKQIHAIWKETEEWLRT